MTDFVDYYLKKGFGSMTKKDVELWVFNYLLHNKLKDKRDFEVSKELKIPVSRVKNLRYETELIYEESDSEQFVSHLKESLKKAKCRVGASEGKVILSIPDKMLRQYLADRLEQDGRIYDSSFNSAIVSLSASDYFWILETLYLNEEQKKDIINQSKKYISESDNMPTTISEVLVSTGIGLGKNVLEKFVGDYATDRIVENISELIKQIKK